MISLSSSTQALREEEDSTRSFNQDSTVKLAIDKLGSGALQSQ